MAKNTRWTPEDLKKAGLIQVNGGDFVKASSQVNTGKVDKLPNLLEKDYSKLSTKMELIDMLKKNSKPTENRKIKNAVKVEVGGIKFDSRLEAYMHSLLQGAGINFEFQKTYLLQEKFRYGTEAIRAITLTVDFFIPASNLIIDSKGLQTQQGAMRYKMLKKLLFDTGPNNLPKIIMPKNQKECRELVNRLLYDPL